MKQKIAILVGFAVAVGVIFYVKRPSKDDPGEPAKPAIGSATDAGASPTEVTEITFEYSSEKREWLETSVAQFHAAHPEIKVTLIAKGSLEAAQAILDGTDKPVVWSPADSLVANLLYADYKTKQDVAPFATTGPRAPQPLLLTPLVFAVWEDRAKPLLAASGGNVSWKAIHKAVTSPKGWPAIGGKPSWGFVKLGHTDPNKSNSGMQALVLMAYEFFGTKQLAVEQMLDSKFQAFVRELEDNVTHNESSTGIFMTDMIRFGPSKYDIALVYESLAVSQLDNAQGRWGSLRIYYPSPTIWSDHPIVIFERPWVSAKQRAAAEALAAFLRSAPVQALALRFGFRPADPAVPMKTSDAANPFNKMAQFGMSLELPPVAQTPDGAVIRNLLMMWSRVVKPR